MGAFDNYKQPGQDAQTDTTTGGAFSGYKPPATTAAADTGWSLAHNPILSVRGPWNAPANQPLEQTAAWNKPADASWSDYAAAHFQPIDDMVRHATNVFGLGDRFAAKMDELTGTGPTVGTLTKNLITGQPTDALSLERAKSAQADARMPEQNKLAADVLGYYPVAAEGIGTKIADTAAPYLSKLPFTGAGKWLGGVVGGGTEGVGATEAGSYGRTGEGASTGQLLFGAAQGLPGGVASRTGNVVKPLDEAALTAAHDATRVPMKAVQFKPNDVNNAIDRASAGLTGPQRGGLSPDMQNLISNFKKEISSGNASADDINGYARGIFTGVKNDADYAMAGKFRDAMNNDVMARTMPTSNHSLGEAASMNADANQAFARLKDNEWLSNTNILKAPGEAATRLADPTKLYGPNERDALGNLADFAPKTKTQTTPTSPGAGAWQGARDATAGIASDKLAPGLAGWLLGGHPLAGILSGIGIKTGIGAYKGYQGSKIQQAMDAAHATLTTGQKLSPSDYIGPAAVRNAARTGVTGILAGGGL